MSFGIIDAVIILIILLGALIGFKNGAIKEGTKFIGLFLIIIISFLLKDRLMVFMYENLPFFDFFGMFEGLDAINILFYQLIAFLIIFAALMFILRVLIVITGVVEWLLKMTVFLSIPSKFIGLFVGALEYYVYLFIGLYILNMPVFGLTLVNESEMGMAILKDTPILSKCVDNTVKVYSDVWNVINNRGNLTNSQVNTYVLATLLDNKLITIDSARKLVESNYIVIEDPSILDDYKEDESFFEEIGGCLLLGGCEGDNSYIDEVYKIKVSAIGEQGSYDGIDFKVTSIISSSCIERGDCDDEEEIKVGVQFNNKLKEENMILNANGRYIWIKGTTKYIYADIEDGKLVVGIAKYKIRRKR